MKRIKEFLLDNQGMRQRAAKNAFWLSAGKIGSKILRTVVVIYAARKLGTAGYGIFSYILSIAAFFTVFADMGISQVLTREVSQKPKERKEYFTTSFWTSLGLIALVGAVIMFGVPLFSNLDKAEVLLPLAVILVLFDGIRNLTKSFFRGLEEMEKEALVTLVTNVVITAVGLVVLLKWATPANITYVYVGGAGIGTLLGAYLLQDEFKSLFKSFKKNLIKPIFNSAWPVALMGTFGAFMLNIDILLLGYFLDSSRVGLYSAAQKPVQVLYILPTILASTLFPIFSKLAGKGEEKLKSILERGVTSSYLFGIPIAAGGALLSPEIINLLYGQEYMTASPVFQILIFTTLLVFPGMILSNYLLAEDEHKKMAPVVIGALIVNIVLDIILIPSFGIIGCAIATILVSIIYNGSAWVISKNLNGFKTFPHLGKIIFSTFLMASGVLILKALSVHVLINIAVAVLIYFGLLKIMKEQTLDEIKKAIPI